MLFVVPITDMMVIYGANGYENIRPCKVRLGGAHGAYVPWPYCHLGISPQRF